MSSIKRVGFCEIVFQQAQRSYPGLLRLTSEFSAGITIITGWNLGKIVLPPSLPKCDSCKDQKTLPSEYYAFGSIETDWPDEWVYSVWKIKSFSVSFFGRISKFMFSNNVLETSFSNNWFKKQKKKAKKNFHWLTCTWNYHWSTYNTKLYPEQPWFKIFIWS